MREYVAWSWAWTELHKALLSVAERDMIGLAVPERRKSASLTALIKESWRTGGVGEMKLKVGLADTGGELGVASGREGVDCEKWRTSLNGNGAGALLSGSNDDRA
jgi:hypothetical protein